MYVFMPKKEDISSIFTQLIDFMSHWAGEDIAFNFKSMRFEEADCFYTDDEYCSVLLLCANNDWDNVINKNGTLNNKKFGRIAMEKVLNTIGVAFPENLEEEAQKEEVFFAMQEKIDDIFHQPLHILTDAQLKAKYHQ